MAESDESEYEYSDNEYESDEEEASATNRGNSPPLRENSNPNSPPSPGGGPIEESIKEPRIRKNPSWQSGDDAHGSTRRKINGTLSPTELLPRMEQEISDVSQALGVSTTAAAPLLRHYRWSSQRVLQAFMNDPEQATSQAGVMHRCQSQAVATPKGTEIDGANDCSICMDTMTADNSLAMSCGHMFCLGCWQQYLENAIQNEGATCMATTCPEASCSEIITEQEVQTAAPHLLAKYREYQLRNFVEHIGRWCPGPGCDRMALPALETCTTDCDKCSIQFCSSCAEEPHAPACCTDLRNWTEKNSNESETANWLTANTKCCPECRTPIEKNGGCMHIMCAKCKHGFCWVCMGAHHVHQCNAYKQDDGQVKAKTELERYLHYYVRYKGHNDAQTFARKELEKLEKRENEFKVTSDLETKSSGEGSAALPEYLKEANQQLVHCRRVLKYTYVFAFFQFMDPEQKSAKECFEFHQGTLEGLTEGLSKATEMEEIDKQDVVNRTRAIGEFIKNVLSYIAEEMDGN